MAKQSIFTNFHVSQLVTQMKLAIMTKQVLYIEGPPGAGKTQILGQTADDMGYAPVTIMLSEIMPEDIGGIVTADTVNNITARLTPDIIARICGERANSGKPVLAFFDEINNATAMVLSSCMKLLHEGVAGGYKVPDDTVFMAAGNDPATSSVANDLPAPLFNRMAYVKFAGPSWEEFEGYAIRNKFHPAVLGFLNQKPDYLSSKADFTLPGANPTPRSWEAVSDLLWVLDALENTLPRQERMYAIASRVGEETAMMTEAALKWADKLTPYRDVVNDPNNALAPSEFIPAYMQVLAVAAQISSVQEAERCILYVKRLPAEVQSVFTTTLLGRDDSVEFIDAFDLDVDVEGVNGFAARASLGSDLQLRA